LTKEGSASALHAINSTRTNFGGVNKKPIPPGEVSVAKNGSFSVNTPDGRQFGVRPNGTLASFSAGGRSATFGVHGQIRSVHTPTMDIVRNVRGQQTVIVRRPDHSVLVSTGPRGGYLQRSVTVNGRAYVQRSYVMGSVHYTRVFTTYTFHGVALIHYVPAFYYAPPFYGWAYYPWRTPATVAWAWSAAPWYGYYGPYFAFAPAYPSAAFWLTDYYLAQTMADAYQIDSQPVQPPDYPPDPALDPAAANELDAQAVTPITPELKQAIAGEVREQLAYENAGAANPEQAPTLNGLPQVLVANHLFVAGAPLNVLTGDNQTCGISIGDVLRLNAAPADNSTAADLTVMTSRQTDCPAGAQVTVSLADLQDMQNNFRAQLDSGLQTLHSGQGQGGLPAAPPSAIAPPPRPVEDLPPDDPTVQAQLQAAQQQAAATETQVTQAAFANETQ
jgi:hypothetical protein